MNKGFLSKKNVSNVPIVTLGTPQVRQAVRVLENPILESGMIETNLVGSKHDLVEPVSLGNIQTATTSFGELSTPSTMNPSSVSLNMDDAPDCSMNGTQKVEPIPLTKDTSHGDDLEQVTSADTVEHLIDNAHQNFVDTMNKIQSEIGANEVNISSTPPSFGTNVNMNKSATSGPNAHKVDTTNGTGVKSVSYAGATSNEPLKHVSNFRRLECSKKKADVDLSVPMNVVEEVNLRFENTLYGYFLGQRLAFPVVDYYVRNAWAKFGIQKVMMNVKGFFFFKFNSSKGVDDLLENGPWLIRNVSIILKPWTLNTNLLKEDLTIIPVWVKFHDVPLAMFSDDGLSLLATLIGTPKRLDAFQAY
jgi:hypothetical protein